MSRPFSSLRAIWRLPSSGEMSAVTTSPSPMFVMEVPTFMSSSGARSAPVSCGAATRSNAFQSCGSSVPRRLTARLLKFFAWAERASFKNDTASRNHTSWLTPARV